jgi:hypothetical protein
MRYDTTVKPLAVPLAVLALAAALAAAGSAQTAPPAAGTPVPWQPRPVIIIDPRAYLATPGPGATPRPMAKSRATPRPGATHRPAATLRASTTPRAHRTTAPGELPETFERLDTSPPPARPPS